MTGFDSKRQMAKDKVAVTDIDGHVVGRKPKKAAALDRDSEMARLNEKIEFLARTNMLYSDWEHRETQVTSDLIRKGIEEAKINAELRAEIERLKVQRPWVGLTDEEIADAVRPLYGTNESAFMGLTDDIPTARAIEAKLKEKNT